MRGGGEYIEPYVSYVEEDNSVHYNKPPETKLIVYYDIQDISSPTTIFTNYDNSVKSIEVGGETISEFSQGDVTYQFNSVGEHVIKYEFNSPTTVGNSAPLFYNLTTIKRAVIPDTFTAISPNAFNSCSGLTSVTIGNGVTSIGHDAFIRCTGLTSITIGNNVETIGTLVFGCCSGLTSIAIPDSVTSISSGMCSGCTSLSSVTIGNSVTSIANSAFQDCRGLTTVTIGSGVTSIGNNAFYFCNSLQTIISLATTAPTITSFTFYSVKMNGTLTVPQGSTGYDTWMQNANYYLGVYNWTKVEQ